MSIWGAIAEAATKANGKGIDNLPYSESNPFAPSLNVDPLMRDYDNGENNTQTYVTLGLYPSVEAAQAHINEVLANRATAQATGGYVDAYGRLFNKGAKIEGPGGYYTYTGNTRQADMNNPEYATDGGRLTGMELAAPGWEWTDTGSSPASDGDKQNTLINSGIINQGPDKGSGFAQGVKTWASYFAPAVTGGIAGEMGAFGSSVPFGGGTITMSEALAEGATASDLAQMGFPAAEIATATGSTATPSIPSAGGTGGAGANPANGYIDSGIAPVVPAAVDTASGGGTLATLGTGGAVAGGLAPWVQPALAAGALGTSIAGGVLGANAASDAAHNAADATTAAANTAAQATLTGQREAIAAQEKMYNQQRADFAPFRDVAPRSLATLQSAVYGEPQTYTDPQGNKQTANGQQFDLASLSRQQTDALNTFDPTKTEAYKWQLGQGQEALAKSLTMQGRGSGSVATNAMTKFAGNLGAQEYDKGYQRLSSLNDLNYNRMSAQKADYQNQLLNLIKTAQGAAGSTSSAGQNFANASSTASNTAGTNLANIAVNQGTNLANANLAQGQSQANLYSGLTSLPFTAANTAINAGWKPFA